MTIRRLIDVSQALFVDELRRLGVSLYDALDEVGRLVPSYDTCVRRFVPTPAESAAQEKARLEAEADERSKRSSDMFKGLASLEGAVVTRRPKGQPA